MIKTDCLFDKLLIIDVLFMVVKILANTNKAINTYKPTQNVTTE